MQYLGSLKQFEAFQAVLENVDIFSMLAPYQHYVSTQVQAVKSIFFFPTGNDAEQRMKSGGGLKNICNAG